MEKKKIEDEDINLLHKIFYYQKCAQIATLEAEINEYKELLKEVNLLKEDLADCATSLKNTHTYASSGISCVDFNEDIANIGQYANKMENLSVSIEGVIGSIDSEISKKYDEIASIKSTMWI